MTARRELEIKLELPPTSVGRLKKIPLLHALKAPKRATEVSVYFDKERIDAACAPHRQALRPDN
jgi:hypothetical protein